MRYFHLKNEGYKNLKKYHNLHFVSNIKEGDVKLVKLLYFKRFFFQGVNLYFEVRENELIINYACVYTKHHITKELLEQIRKITFEEAQKNQKLRIPLLFDDYKIEVKKISA
jgi:Neuraminidase (sialidase)